MFKRGTAIVLILVALALICSCKSDPQPDDEVGEIAGVGVIATTQIMYEYTEKGSYTGVSTRGADDTICFSFSNATVSVNLSDIDPSMGTHTITVNGEVVCTYEAYPATYPYSVSYNIKFNYAGKNHTVEIKGKFSGVSTRTFSVLKVDGKSYDPSVLNE